ncbi:uncharacterized protein [Epargyreus clarus]|uniref:uncharacterized protein n=1 Tax=Epargyreus clarus TaxID=520877 RepID=UPI003C2FBE53
MDLLFPLCWLTLLYTTFAADLFDNDDNEIDTPFVYSPRNPSLPRIFTPCYTRSNTPGICTHIRFCINDHEIEHVGKTSSIIRSKRRTEECSGEYDTCCPEKNIISTTTATPEPEVTIPDTTLPPEETTTVSNTRDPKCITYRQTCPWCVKLYHNGSDAYSSESEFFCMGVMIGPKVILTTATCVLQASTQTLWARVPSSANPEADYLVQRRIKHPHYNSDTLDNDVAILVTKKNIKWNIMGPQEACIDPGYSDQTYCELATVDNKEAIQMIPISTYNETCGASVPPGSACVYLDYTNPIIVPGAPIICPNETGEYTIMGLGKTRRLRTRFFNEILFMNLAAESSWLKRILEESGVKKDELKLTVQNKWARN